MSQRRNAKQGSSVDKGKGRATDHDEFVRNDPLAGVQLSLTPKQATSQVRIKLSYKDKFGVRRPFPKFCVFSLPVGHVTSLNRVKRIGEVFKKVGYLEMFDLSWPQDLQGLVTRTYSGEVVDVGMIGILGQGDMLIWGTKLSETYESDANLEKCPHGFVRPEIHIVMNNRHPAADGSPLLVNPGVQLKLPSHSGRSYLKLFDEVLNEASNNSVQMLDQLIKSESEVDLQRMPPPPCGPSTYNTSARYVQSPPRSTQQNMQTPQHSLPMNQGFVLPSVNTPVNSLGTSERSQFVADPYLPLLQQNSIYPQLRPEGSMQHRSRPASPAPQPPKRVRTSERLDPTNSSSAKPKATKKLLVVKK